ncbi:hypothetical protein GA0111570_102268 [Raineyella antarctica]|uniref:V8-like Glu-specific endopeptidase n=1 Tax=Raineyella antarctica TaxID=1577474 RepID=A0A1G6GEP8_9ACTN|nr:hypothetical protein [Raineyella antarctica]SDB80478.1 hypothetical protein GA0111570_102268 [Raineyella antarctica]
MRQHTPRLWAATLSVALALAGAILGSPVRPAAAPPPDRGASSEHQRIIDFWTPDKVAKAVPRDFVGDPGTGRFKLNPARAKPGPGSGTGVLGATWTGGLVQNTTGKVLFAMAGTYYVCSASVVPDTSTSVSVILTAGHCAWDNAGQKYATDWMFVPDYADAPAPLITGGSFCAQTVYGCWTASALTVDADFANQTSFNTTATLNDFAFATVGAGGLSGSSQLDSTVGTQPIQFSQVPNGKTTDLFGYPAASPYNGSRLIYSEGSLGLDRYNSNKTYRVASNMTGGCSGGPWFSPFTTASGSGTIMSLNSYTYSGQSYLHGPILNSKTQSLYDAAPTAKGNQTLR